jgi:hypothetical protein
MINSREALSSTGYNQIAAATPQQTHGVNQSEGAADGSVGEHNYRTRYVEVRGNDGGLLLRLKAQIKHAGW